MAEIVELRRQEPTEGQALPGLGTLLDWYIAAERSLWEREYDKPRDGWRASSIGFCLRAQWRQRKGIPETIVRDARGQRTMLWGDHVHDFMKRLLWRTGLMVAEEVRVEHPGYALSAHIDAIIGTPIRTLEGEEQERVERWSPAWRQFIATLRAKLIADFGLDQDEETAVGVEIKSTHSYAMKKLPDEGAKEHHLFQVAAQALCAFYEHEKGTLEVPMPSSWRIAYVGKDAVGVLEFPLTGGYISALEERLDTLNGFWEEDEEPPCSCVGWQKNYCAYSVGKDRCCE